MSGTGDTVGALFRAGNLADAVAAANAAVRKAPGDIAARVLLAELLVFAGNLERADVILDAASQVEPEAAVVVAEFRQLLRADMARRQLRRDGRVPEFLGEPSDTQRLQLAAWVALRAGDRQEAARLTGAAELGRPHVAGMSGDAAFDDFRDADDLCAGSFEVLTTTGKYFWIPTERVASIDFHPPRRARDLMWRRATMSVRAGPDGDVYLPAIYGSEDAALADALKLGRQTDWIEDGGPVRGMGQRLFLVGEEAVGIMDLGTLEFGE
ncbi:MAG: tetratricopeptide repeat protein [Acetobacteraceae bacterium]|nr:tetratricopeptide repeat protein [Acetobacteraceae bacterium]